MAHCSWETAGLARVEAATVAQAGLAPRGRDHTADWAAMDRDSHPAAAALGNLSWARSTAAEIAGTEIQVVAATGLRLQRVPHPASLRDEAGAMAWARGLEPEMIAATGSLTGAAGRRTEMVSDPAGACRASAWLRMVPADSEINHLRSGPWAAAERSPTAKGLDPAEDCPEERAAAVAMGWGASARPEEQHWATAGMV